MAYTKEILTLAVEIGDTMLRNGAEIYRVEDTVERILYAYEVEEFDVYVLSNGIFASANENKEDSCSIVRHVPLGSVNLGKVAALNQLTRDICSHKCSLIDSWDRLDKCKSVPDFPSWLQVLSCGIGSGGFSYLFGGTWLDLIFAFGIGICEQFLLFATKKGKVSRILTNIFASLFVTILTMIVARTGLGLHQDKVIIGSIMPLVPGIAFTTAIRDIYNGDYLSGTIHLLDAAITAICIAVGACLPFVAMHYLGGM